MPVGRTRPFAFPSSAQLGTIPDYGRNLLAAMAGDIRFNPPSAVREAGFPVLGSRLGGIAEKVRDGVDGLLFEPGNSSALAELLALILNDRSKLPRPKSAGISARTFADVAADMDRVYRAII